MVRRCVWGRCNTDERYRDRLIGVTLLPFPKPKTNLEKCLRWIKACGRPHEQLNVDKINGNRNKVVCSKHFVGGNGPTEQYPDPLPADGSKCTPSRPLPKKRYLNNDENGLSKKKLKFLPLKENTSTENNGATLIVGTDHTYAGGGCSLITAVHDQTSSTRESSIQTDEKWVSSLEVLTMTAEIESLKAKIKEQQNTITNLQQANTQIAADSDNKWFGVQAVLNNKTNHKDLFKHYTGITYVRFVALLSFLIPENFSLQYEKGRSDLKSLSNEDGLFLTLTRCRRDFSLADLAMKFGLKIQTAGVVFNTWLDHMYFKLGQLPLWPHRNTLIKNMPKDFKKDYPTTLIIIDGTELFTQSPCALGLQSQFYSDYKGNTTLKGLIGCDSRGTLLFVSELFSGSVSDKVITEESGFYEVLKTLKAHGYIQDGDSIMADKGFTIADELAKLNLNLNIPPFVRGGKQLTSGERKETQKIAKHRIHIERLIAKVKKNKILKSAIPTSMFARINKIWTVCCHLTLFEDIFVKDKE